MNTHHFVRTTLADVDLPSVASRKYDLGIFALGFESRASHLARKFSFNVRDGMALGFDYAKSYSYASNLDFFWSRGCTVHDDVGDAVFEQLLAEHVSASLAGDAGVCHVLVDVSSFTRFRLAAILICLRDFCVLKRMRMEIDFVYSIASFSDVPATYRPNTHVGPVHPKFAGWSQNASFSTAVVLGLGYEQDQALGAVEYLQASPVYAFFPGSEVQEYVPAVEQANSILLGDVSKKEQIIKYDVGQPKNIVTALESIVRGLQASHNVVLVPFGPKMFVLCSLLIGLLRKEVAVWRVSQGRHIQPSDKTASGHYSALHVSFDCTG